MTETDPYHDKLFDHAYDGIQEYDNPMPRWWVMIFWGSIIFAIPYVMWYHLGKGDSIWDNLEAEKAAFAEQLMATYGDLQPDDATILSYMDNEVAMAGMAGLFKGNCAQCHLAEGNGNIGPNLTDDHWKNVTTVSDIATILDEGIDGKGMPAWGSKFTQTQIVLLSAYVAQLRRNPLPGKAPEGTVIPPWPPAPPPDSGAEDGAPS